MYIKVSVAKSQVLRGQACMWALLKQCCSTGLFSHEYDMRPVFLLHVELCTQSLANAHNRRPTYARMHVCDRRPMRTTVGPCTQLQAHTACLKDWRASESHNSPALYLDPTIFYRKSQIGQQYMVTFVIGLFGFSTTHFYSNSLAK